MLLLEFPINGVTQYISNEMCSLTHSWKPYIKSFTAPSWSMATEHGGMVRFGGGSVTISAKLFQDLGVWPPPLQSRPTAKHTETTEAAAVTLFTSYAHLVSYNNTDVQYDIRDIEYSQKLLNEAIDHDGNMVDLPMAFGPVVHVTPIRLPDIEVGGITYPHYHLGGIQTGDSAIHILGISYVDATTVQIITDGPHGFSSGNTVIIAGTDNLGGSHVISDATADHFNITAVFAVETVPINAVCYPIGGWSVFENGVAIQENAVAVGDGTFYLTDYVENSHITISGTGPYTTVDDAASYVQTKLALTETGAKITTYSNTYARTPSPSISRWETSQQTVTDFLSYLCACFTHLFYIEGVTLNLVDLYKDNGSRTLSDHQYFAHAEYSKPNPVKKFISTWQTYYHKVPTVEDALSGGGAHMVAAEDHKVEELLYAYGDEMSITPYHSIEANVRSALLCIKAIYELDRISFSFPMSSNLPIPGEKVSISDITVPLDSPGYLRVRNIDYDFMNHKVRISGDGRILQGTDRRESCPVVTGFSGATTATIDSFDMSLGRGCIWKYVLYDAAFTNMRTGKIQAAWDQAAGGNIVTTPDNHSDDIGTTLGVVSITADKLAATIRLRATSSGGDWYIAVVRTVIHGGVPVIG